LYPWFAIKRRRSRTTPPASRARSAASRVALTGTPVENQRGRSYARKGQVVEFSLTQGTVTARVQGSRPQPYKVTIKVLPLTTPRWREVERRLASQALFRAKLLAREMPAEIEEVFASCGTPLFPRSGGRPGHALQLPGLGSALQAPGRGLLRAGRGFR
jgi:hypothetical protein